MKKRQEKQAFIRAFENRKRKFEQTADGDVNDKLRTAFEAQKNACTMLGSPLTAALVGFCRDDFAANQSQGGPVADLVRGWQGDPLNDNVPLRLAGFAHFMALQGDPIGRFYESCGGKFEAQDEEALRADLQKLFYKHRDGARAFLRRTPQTNETGRAALMLLGFSEIAKRTSLPLRLREMGASAGLNLFFDRFHYVLDTDKGALHWGDINSPLTLQAHWRGTPPELADRIEIADRRGCDLRPVDITDATERRALESWIWGDMPDRRARLLAALKIADTMPPVIDRADAAGWVAAQIIDRPKGQATVLYHSIVWPYLSVAQRFAIESAFAQAGENVTRDNPLVWLKMDGRELGTIARLSYTIWTGDNGPAGEEVILGPCHPHGLDMDIEAVF